LGRACNPHGRQVNTKLKRKLDIERKLGKYRRRCEDIIKPLKTVCLSGKLLLVFASTVILGSESRGTHDLILLSDRSGDLQI
jgi:hypothetical protein